MKQTGTTQEQAPVEIIVLVPELRTRPVIGGGCCAVSADFLIEETLRELDQVRDVSISEDEGAVRVRVTGADEALRREVRERIESLGLAVLG